MPVARKSTRVNKRKWPCGRCGLQCNDNTVFCEGCGVWYHVKCDGLSQTDLRSLKRLTEDYLCSSCTHVRGNYDFSATLRRLEIASKLGMLETAVEMERIFLCNTPGRTTNTEELKFGTSQLDIVAQAILRRTGEFYH